MCLAQQLIRQGQTVARLVLLDTRVPGHDSQRNIRAWLQGFLQFIKTARPMIKPIASYVRSGLYLLTVAKNRNGGQTKENSNPVRLIRWAGLDIWRFRLLSEAEVASKVAPDASLRLFEMPAVRRILNLVGEHGKLMRRYTTERYPGRITLFRAVRDVQEETNAEDASLGWSRLAENGVEIHTIQANHVALMVKPYVENLAHDLLDCLHPASGNQKTG